MVIFNCYVSSPEGKLPEGPKFHQTSNIPTEVRTQPAPFRVGRVAVAVGPPASSASLGPHQRCCQGFLRWFSVVSGFVSPILVYT